MFDLKTIGRRVENHSNKSGTRLKAKRKDVYNQHIAKIEERPLEALFMVRIHPQWQPRIFPEKRL
jgi:hypothetical protein